MTPSRKKYRTDALTTLSSGRTAGLLARSAAHLPTCGGQGQRGARLLGPDLCYLRCLLFKICPAGMSVVGQGL
jgi:hypothetical protein